VLTTAPLSFLAATLLAASACQTQTSWPTLEGTPQDAGSKTDYAKVVDRMLERCHGPVRGSMENAYLEMTKEGSKHTDKVLLGGTKKKPDYLRITHPDGSTSILNGKHAGRYNRGTDGRYTKVTLTDDQKKDLKDLHALLRTSLLGPLYEAKKVERQGPNVYRLILDGGETWRLEVDPKTDLPRSLTGPPGKVTFDEHKATGVTFLPKEVTLGRFGKHHLNLLDSGLVFNKPYFEDPETPLARFKETRKLGAAPSDPRTPVLQKLPGRNSLVLPDPGDWEKRIALLGKNGRELYSQGQASADQLYFYEEKGKRYMAIPFEPDIDRGSQPFLRRKHQDVIYRPPQMVAAVVTRGTERGAIAAGSKALDNFVKEQKLVTTGPLRVIPFVAPENGVPEAKELENLKVRLELPVARLKGH
jgi:hypothetical protein